MTLPETLRTNNLYKKSLISLLNIQEKYKYNGIILTIITSKTPLELTQISMLKTRIKIKGLDKINEIIVIEQDNVYEVQGYEISTNKLINIYKDAGLLEENGLLRGELSVNMKLDKEEMTICKVNEQELEKILASLN